MRRWFRQQLGTPWVRVLALCAAGLVVGSAGLAYRDWRGVERPCAFCKAECRVRSEDPVPLHEKCRVPYADSKIEGWSVGVTATREDRMATKTQVTGENSSVAGSIGVFNQEAYPIMISAPVKAITFTCGPGVCSITDVSTGGWIGDPPNPPPNNVLTFQVYLSRSPYFFASEYIYFNEDTPTPWNIERSFSAWATGNRVWRTESTNYGPGRSGKPVFAREVAETDEWLLEDDIAWSITFGSWTYSGGPEPIKPFGPRPIDALGFFFDVHKGAAWTKYASVSGVTWDGGSVNFSRYEKCSSPGVKPPSASYGYYLDGLAGGMDLLAQNTAQWQNTVTLGRPLIVDFSHFSVRSRVGDLLGDVRISGPPFLATNHYPPSLDWSTDP